MTAVSLLLCVVAVLIFQQSLAAPSGEGESVAELRANITALWAALGELQAEVRESFDVHVSMENHEHQVHHLGHEDTGHEIHHSERHLQHLEKVHGRTAAGPVGIEPHKPHTADEKELLRHEHEFHHANASFETEDEHKAHHDEAMLKHLEVDHGHGEHNGVHHGKLNKEMTHELSVHFMGATCLDGHAEHHNEHLLKHLEEDDGHGPSLDRPKPSTTTTIKPSAGRTAKKLQAYCDMRQNRALQRTKHSIGGRVFFTQTAGGPLSIQVSLKGIKNSGTTLHGFHVHELVPSDEGNCNQVGSHFNPSGSTDPDIKHVGDFGNVEAVENQGINVVLTDQFASLSGPNSILNRSLVLNEKEDGNSGRRLACCVIRASS